MGRRVEDTRKDAYPGGARSAEDICQVDTGEAQSAVCELRCACTQSFEI